MTSFISLYILGAVLVMVIIVLERDFFHKEPLWRVPVRILAVIGAVLSYVFAGVYMERETAAREAATASNSLIVPPLPTTPTDNVQGKR